MPGRGEHLKVDQRSIVTCTSDPLHNPNRDVAFLTLEEPVSTDAYLPIKFTSITALPNFGKDNERPLRISGYPDQNDPYLNHEGRTEICGEQGYFPREGLFYHDASTRQGQSAAPLYTFEDPVTVYGIHVGGKGKEANVKYHYSDKTSNVAIDGGEIAKHLADYQAGRGCP